MVVDCKPVPDLIVGEYNVVFLVADSCRYDSAEKAETPFLCSLSLLRRAEAPATYTLPSHMSFFIGILPVLVDANPEYLPGIRQIWRSVNASESGKTAAVLYEGENIIDYYWRNGYAVIGAGGVSFFSSAPGNILPRLFPQFIHFEKPFGLSRTMNIPRQEAQFPLANIDRIVEKLDISKPFFLFVNCPETHIPYDSPMVEVSEGYRVAIRKLYAVDSVKHCSILDRDGLVEEERKLLMDAQRQSLEWIDLKAEELCLKVSNGLPTLVIVMGDHGDEFGEGGRYGHAHYHPSVMYVPLWCGIL